MIAESIAANETPSDIFELERDIPFPTPFEGDKSATDVTASASVASKIGSRSCPFRTRISQSLEPTMSSGSPSPSRSETHIALTMSPLTPQTTSLPPFNASNPVSAQFPPPKQSVDTLARLTLEREGGSCHIQAAVAVTASGVSLKNTSLFSTRSKH